MIGARASRAARRIAMVAACPFPSARGSQVLIRELAQALAENGHAVHVVTYPFAESLAPVHGMFVHRAPFARAWRRRAKLGWRKVLLDLALVKTVYRVVRRERIEVIHAHNYEGLVVGLLVRALTRIPLVYHSHNALGDELGYYFRAGARRRAASWFGRGLDRILPRLADFSIALTPELEGFLRACGVPARRLTVVPPGASVGAWPDSGAADTFEGRFVVMYTGNMDPYQDLAVLFEGFAAFRRCVETAVLVLVTHDPNWSACAGARLHELAREGQASVVVTSAFSRVRKLLGRADVLVCPRSSWSGFPMKLINYMAAAKPVIAAEGSAKTIANGQTGLTFANGDAQALAARLKDLFDDPLLRRRLGEAARASVRLMCSWPRAVTAIEHVYGALAEARRAPVVLASQMGKSIIGIDKHGGGRISAVARRPSQVLDRRLTSR